MRLPVPGPTSITPSPAATRAAATMFARILSSVQKFWPKDLCVVHEKGEREVPPPTSHVSTLSPAQRRSAKDTVGWQLRCRYNRIYLTTIKLPDSLFGLDVCCFQCFCGGG